MDNKMTAEQALEWLDSLHETVQGTNTITQEKWPEAQAAAAAFRAALSAPRVPDGWRPIETAPLDGTAVLVMRDIWHGTASGRAEECNGHNTYVAEWWSEEGDSGKWVCYMNAVLDPACPIVPTHWMPLPHPPSTLAASPEPVAQDQQLTADLLAEVEALRVDAERYRFIRGSFGYNTFGINLPCGASRPREQIAKEADDAIDAARLREEAYQ